jgi:hypothetical protein
VDAAKRDAHELPPERPRDRLAEAGLADAGRPDEAEDRLAGDAVGGGLRAVVRRRRLDAAVLDDLGGTGLAVLAELLDRQILEDAVLDLLEVVVVLVEDRARLRDVDLAAGQRVPGQAGHPVEVGADDAVLRRGRRHVREPIELALGLAARLLGQSGLFDSAAQGGDVLVLVLVAELLADRAELLAQEVLALRLGHPLAGLGGDLLAQLADGQLVLEQLDELLELGVHLVQLQQLLAHRPGQRDRRGDQVRELARVGQVLGGAGQLVRQVFDERHESAEQIDDRPPQSLDLDARRQRIRHDLDLGRHVRLGLGELADAHPFEALEHQAQRPIRGAHELVDDADRADPVEVVRAGQLGGVRLLGHEGQHPLAAHHVVDQLDRAFLAD